MTTDGNGNGRIERDILSGAVYRLRPSSDRRRNYFEKKYGTANPLYVVESNTKVIWPGGWYHEQLIGCFLALASLLPDYGIPSIINSLSYYGKIEGLGEIVLLDEIGEEVVNEPGVAEGTEEATV